MTNRKHRSRMRGAAMVEGAVVLPMLAVFFGVMMYVHNAYLKKQVVMSETRFKAFSNAAHACMSGDSSTGGQHGIDPGQIPKEGDAPDQDKTESLKTTWLETKANTTAVAVAMGRTRRVDARSAVYCNPVTYGATDLPGAAAGALAKVAGAVGKGLMKALKFAGHAIQYVAQWAMGWI